MKKENKFIIIGIISFIVGFIACLYITYSINQEDEQYTVTVDATYEFCNHEFFINEYITGISNNLDIKVLINDINNYCK